MRRLETIGTTGACVAVLLLLGCAGVPADPEGGSPQQRADALRQEHRQLFRQGQILQALEAAQQEVELRQTFPDITGPDLAESLHDLGVYASEAGDYGRAGSLLEEALALRRQGLGDSHPAVAETLMARIPGLMFAGRDEDAAGVATQALSISRQAGGDDDERVARALRWLGVIRNSLGKADTGQYRLAAELLQEALSIQRRRLGPEHADVAETMLALGQNEFKLDNLGRAEQIVADTVQMLRRLKGPDDLVLADALYQHGLVLAALGEQPAALERHEEELAIRRRHFERHYKIIRCRVSLSNAYRGLGEDDKALPLARDNVRDHESLYGRDFGWCMLNLNLALLQIYRHEFADAEAVLEETGGEISRLATEGAENDILVRTLNHRRVALALRAGRFAEAERRAREQVAGLRSRVAPGSRWMVMARESLAQALVGQGDLSGAEHELDVAAREYELARGKAGRGTRAATFESTPYELRAAIRLERGELAAAWRDLERARGRVLSDALLQDPVPFELQRVQAGLSDEEAIVGWLDEEIVPGRLRSWAYVVRSAGPVRWQRLPIDPALDPARLGERMAGFRRDVVRAARSSLGPATDPVSPELARSLWRERFGPVSADLEGIATLLLVPSGAMAGLPLDALEDGSGALVGERHALAYIPSAAFRTWMSENGPRPGPGTPRPAALALGDPAFREEHLAPWSPEDPAARGPEHGSILRSAVRGDRAAMARLPRLPWSRLEAEHLAGMLPDSTLLLGPEASAANLRQAARGGELARYDIVHLATHALVDQGQPGRSALVLSQVGSPVAADGLEPGPGIITAEEIGRDWHLDARLVTLSACETALGRQVFGEGTVGFSYPLFQAGARSMLVSLWPVNDRASALLMDRFYDGWLGPGGMSEAQALRAAKLWLRDWRDETGHRPYAHPYFWAAFILIGDA